MTTEENIVKVNLTNHFKINENNTVESIIPYKRWIKDDIENNENIKMNKMDKYLGISLIIITIIGLLVAFYYFDDQRQILCILLFYIVYYLLELISM